jgi:hypothetical protein
MKFPGPADLQALCEEGQSLLMATKYLDAEALLERAEQIAWDAGDYDTLSRLYMPLQEARRQRRQLCGEGTVCLDLIAAGPADEISGRRVIENFTHGQLLVAGWKSIEPALAVRQLQKQHRLYVETFLAAAYPMGSGSVVVIVPTAQVSLPTADFTSIDALIASLPAHCIVLSSSELPSGSVPGTWKTYANVMAMWERLHTPFLAAADAVVDLRQRMAAYRRVIQVDYACELAHQKLSDVARQLIRQL